jgi:hypothetical protein
MQHGALVSAGDNTRFIAQVLALAANETMRHIMQTQARPRALEMGWTAIMEKLEGVYLSILDSQEPSRAEQRLPKLYNAA